MLKASLRSWNDLLEHEWYRFSSQLSIVLLSDVWRMIFQNNPSPFLSLSGPPRFDPLGSIVCVSPSLCLSLQANLPFSLVSPWSRMSRISYISLHECVSSFSRCTLEYILFCLFASLSLFVGPSRAVLLVVMESRARHTLSAQTHTLSMTLAALCYSMAPIRNEQTILTTHTRSELISLK